MFFFVLTDQHFLWSISPWFMSRMAAAELLWGPTTSCNTGLLGEPEFHSRLILGLFYKTILFSVMLPQEFSTSWTSHKVLPMSSKWCPVFVNVHIQIPIYTLTAQMYDEPRMDHTYHWLSLVYKFVLFKTNFGSTEQAVAWQVIIWIDDR